ncbi:hypothetical protein IFR05_013764, partial [Cadophora sp. M221]
MRPPDQEPNTLGKPTTKAATVMATPFCKEYDQMIMYIIRSASYKEPEIKLSFAPAILKPQNLFCKKKKELWNNIRNRMVDYPDERVQCPWFPTYFGSATYSGNTNTRMNKIIEHLKTHTGPYVPPCLRIPTSTLSPAPNFQTPVGCKEYVDMISSVVKTTLLFTNPQKITEKEILETINLEGRMWKQVLIERSLQRMVKDNVLIPLCKEKGRRAYKLCTFLEAKRFFRRGNADWLRDERDDSHSDSHQSWLNLRDLLNAKFDSFSQDKLIELFGPDASTRYEALQDEYQSKIKMEILDDEDVPQVPFAIDSLRGYQPTTEIRKGATRERAWTVSSTESESPRPRPVIIKAEPMYPDGLMFSQAPVIDNFPTNLIQLGKRKEHPVDGSPSPKHTRLSTAPNSTDSPALAQGRKYFANKHNATYVTVVAKAVSRTVPNLTAQLEKLQHNSRTVPDLDAQLEGVQHNSTGPADRQEKLPKSKQVLELRYPTPDSESDGIPGYKNPFKAPSIGDLRPPLEIPQFAHGETPTSQPGLYPVQRPQLPGHNVPGSRSYNYSSQWSSQIPPSTVGSGLNKAPRRKLGSVQGNSHPLFNNAPYQHQSGPAGGVQGSNP